jgi:hypothetical protein
LARFLASGFDVIVDSLPRLPVNSNLTGRPVFLCRIGAIDRISARRRLDPKCDDIATRSLLSIAR